MGEKKYECGVLTTWEEISRYLNRPSSWIRAHTQELDRLEIIWVKPLNSSRRVVEADKAALMMWYKKKMRNNKKVTPA